MNKTNIYLNVELIQETTEIQPDGFFSATFYNQGSDTAKLFNIIELTPGTTHIMDFEKDENLISKIPIVFANEEEDRQIVVIKTYVKE